jgi:hypothetical protein
MIGYQTHSSAAALAETPERRAEPRQPVFGSLWMVDHHGSTVLRCQCVEASRTGLRLRVPLGYGVAEGQRYELRSHLPGARPLTEGFDLTGSRWATVVRAQFRVTDNEDYLDVAVTLDDSDSSALSFAAAKPALV